MQALCWVLQCKAPAIKTGAPFQDFSFPGVNPAALRRSLKCLLVMLAHPGRFSGSWGLAPYLWGDAGGTPFASGTRLKAWGLQWVLLSGGEAGLVGLCSLLGLRMNADICSLACVVVTGQCKMLSGWRSQTNLNFFFPFFFPPPPPLSILYLTVAPAYELQRCLFECFQSVPLQSNAALVGVSSI